MRLLTLAVALTAILCAPVLGDSFQTFTGNNANGPTWLRPNEGLPPTTMSTDTVHYSIQSFKLLTAAHCYITGSQNFDGYLHLYRNSFDDHNPFVNLVAGNDDGTAGSGTSYIPKQSGTYTTFTLSAGTYYLVTSGYHSDGVGAFQNMVDCWSSGSGDSAHIVQGSCGSYQGIPEDQAVCLDDRFLVSIYDVTNSPTGIAVPVRMGSADTTLFWFYNTSNWEVMLKVLNGCGVNGRYWVFGGALTNQGYHILVTDVTTGPNYVQKHYLNSVGTRAAAIADTNAFHTCP